MIEDNSFNRVFHRPPNFCYDCGDLLDFELIKDNNIICQKCGGEVSIDSVTSHEVRTTDKYTYSKDWKDKLENINQEKLTLQRQTVYSINIDWGRMS
jgi:hypothetical protein